MSYGYEDGFNSSAQKEEQKRQAFKKESQENREKCRELSKRMAERVAGNGSVLKKFLDTQTIFERYTPNNVLLIMAQRPDAKKLGEYNYWKEKGIWINKEELKNTILILEPGKEYVKKDGSHGKYYNAKKVYDISQTAAKDQEPAAAEYDARALIKALVHNPAATIVTTEADHLPEGKGAYFDTVEQKIFVRKDMNVGDLFRSLTPELIFAEYAKEYREPKKFKREQYEFQVYCATYMLCNKYGIDTKGFSFEQGPEYFDGMDVKTVKYELFKIKDSMEKLSGKMDRVLHAERGGDEKQRTMQNKDSVR